MKVLIFIVIIFNMFSKTINLATHNLQPYGYYTPKGEFVGYAVERVEYSLKKMGYTLRLEVVPWARAQVMAKEDRVDGFFAGSMNSERKERYIQSITIAPQTWTWYLLRTSKMKPSDLNFKKNARVSSFLGANMLEYLEKNNYNVTTRPVDTNALFKLLTSERVDAILVNSLVAKEVIKKQGIEKDVGNYILKEEPLYVHFTKKFIKENPDFLDKFNFYVQEYDILKGKK